MVKYNYNTGDMRFGSVRYKAHLPSPDPLDPSIMKQAQCNNSNPRLASNHYFIPKR